VSQTVEGVSSERAIPSTAAAPPSRLVVAAHEFEAAMMKELLSPLQSDEEGNDQGASSAMTSFAGEALGKALSEHGGFGIADRVIHQILGSSNHNGKSVVTPVSKRNLAVSALK